MIYFSQFICHDLFTYRDLFICLSRFICPDLFVTVLIEFRILSYEVRSYEMMNDEISDSTSAGLFTICTLTTY